MNIACNVNVISNSSSLQTQLLDQVSPGNVDAIVLFLPKNWGSNTIGDIIYITHQVARFPAATPVLIIGCEMTIPDDNLIKYVHPERDNAIKDLCRLALGRSHSIGVRGHLTYTYLTLILGFKAETVDIIFSASAPEAKDGLRNFLSKNCPLLLSCENEIMEFQRNPGRFFFAKSIRLSAPYISVEGSDARLNCDCIINGSKKTLWLETASQYRQFLVSEVIDPFVCAVLPFAMRNNHDIECDSPVSGSLYCLLDDVLIPHLSRYDERLYRTLILAELDFVDRVPGDAVATGMSCGVDSFYSAIKYSNPKYGSLSLTHLYCGNYLYGNDSLVYKRAQAAANDFGLKLVTTKTNLSELLPMEHINVHFFKTLFGILGLRKLFRAYYYSSAEDFGSFTLKDNSVGDTTNYELLLLYCFNYPGMQLLSGGGSTQRVQKTKVISQSWIARKHLNVCLHSNRKVNCGECAKCLRTLLTLDMFNVLDAFVEVFDIPAYFANRTKALSYLIAEKNSVYLAGVYQYFRHNFPDEMNEAERLSSDRVIGPVIS